MKLCLPQPNHQFRLLVLLFDDQPLSALELEQDREDDEDLCGCGHLMTLVIPESPSSALRADAPEFVPPVGEPSSVREDPPVPVVESRAGLPARCQRWTPRALTWWGAHLCYTRGPPTSAQGPAPSCFPSEGATLYFSFSFDVTTMFGAVASLGKLKEWLHKRRRG